MLPQNFDIAIVGAGLAGSALAAALGGSGLRIALLEAQPLSLQWPTTNDDVTDFDIRVSALTAASQQWLAQLGAWESIAARRVAAYRHMSVWDGEGTGAIQFDASDVNRATLGHIVENNLLQCALLHRIGAHDNIQIFSPARVTEFLRSDERIDIALEDGRHLRATLLVAADGANSRVREWADFKMREWDYDHVAIAATVECSAAHQHTAWQIFRREGPLAFLPLQTSPSGARAGDNHFCSIVWSTTPEEAATLMALDDTAFAQALGRAFEFRLGEIIGVGKRLSFPLRARHANNYTQPNIVLIGDAAHTIHPLAGQGINLGLQDAQVLAQEILRANARGLSIADASVLARYQRARKGDNLAMLATMEGFKRLFGAHNLSARLLRNVGLNWVDRSAPLKRILIRQAMGLK